MMDLGIIGPSNSTWTSPLHMIFKRDSNNLRPTGDHRQVIENTISDRYFLPRIHDLTAAFSDLGNPLR